MALFIHFGNFIYAGGKTKAGTGFNLHINVTFAKF